MKTMLALALVGVLSISSLAEAKKQNPQDKAKIKTVQRGPSSAELNCSEGYVKITGQGDTNDFCISEKVEDIKTWLYARSNCHKKIINGRQAHLCDSHERTLACKQNDGLKMDGTQETQEWVSDEHTNNGKVIGKSCDLKSTFYYNHIGNSYHSRCCYR
jgi:hypothetical protein